MNRWKVTCELSVSWAGVEKVSFGAVVGRGDRDRIPGLSDFGMAGVIGYISQDRGDQHRGFPSMGKSSRGVCL